MATDTTKPVPPELWPAGKWTTSPRVTMTTTFGDVVFQLAPNDAQYTVVNFLAYVNSGFYKNLVFHRVISDFVVQGGGFTTGLAQKVPFYLPISLESDNGLKNTRGTIAMARTSDPDSATSQFFVNLVGNSELNHSASNDGYAVFGKVVSGMSVIDKIGKVATGDRAGMSDVPLKNVVIKSAVETTTGTIHNKTGVVSVGGIEAGATWEFSTDKGAHWTRGKTTGSSAFRFKLAEGAYEANDILIRSTDKAGNVSNVGHTGASVVMFAGTAILGNASNNSMKGTGGHDRMYGLAGKDTMTAGNGNDVMDGGSGRDLMIGGAGNDTYIVRDATDIERELLGGGTDLVKSFATAHTLGNFVERGQIMLTTSASLTGNAQSNLLIAGVGNNVLNGGDGTDTVSYASGVSGSQGVTVSLAIATAQVTGGSRTDTLLNVENLTGSAFADNLTGNDNANVLNGGAGADTLNGAGGADVLVGGDNNDLLIGGDGADTLSGGGGRDILRGGEGIDLLTGGASNDRFDFDALTDLGTDVAATDTVTDFTTGDLLDLSGIDADTTTIGDEAFSTTLVSAFTAAGQLKFENGVLSGNTDLDFNTVEFVINLTSVLSLGASDLVV
ncbi:MAG: peptidylprolyl isomerase [Proteobacteria bacterium]|nr:peptidylprolyl isomerase [Pseudomonadota bacterium]